MTKNATFFFESTFLGPHFNDPKMTNVDREKKSSPRAKVHILVGLRSASAFYRHPENPKKLAWKRALRLITLCLKWKLKSCGLEVINLLFKTDFDWNLYCCYNCVHSTWWSALFL